MIGEGPETGVEVSSPTFSTLELSASVHAVERVWGRDRCSQEPLVKLGLGRFWLMRLGLGILGEFP